MGAVSTCHPESSFAVLNALVGEETGVGVVEVTGDEPASIVAAIESREEVVDLELLDKRDDRLLLHVESRRPHLLEPVVRAGVPLSTPFRIENGEATWKITTSASRLSALGDRLQEADVAYTLESVRDFEATEADHLLTNRQQEVLLEAATAGYYDSPRGATLTEVADELGVAKASLSGVLHRAEGRIISWFIDEHVQTER